MIENDPEQGTHQEAPSARVPFGSGPDWQRVRRALPWVLGVALLLVAAGVAGLVTAHLVANQSAAPPPDAAFLPTPTPTASASPRASASPGDDPTAQPSVSPTGPSPTVEPTEPAGPSPTPLEYVVQRGDSIGRIATRFGVTPEAIIELNELRNPNRIFPGQVLLIPAASASPAP